MSATVDIQTETRENVISVPISSVTTRVKKEGGEKPYVAALLAGGTFMSLSATANTACSLAGSLRPCCQLQGLPVSYAGFLSALL